MRLKFGWALVAILAGTLAFAPVSYGDTIWATQVIGYTNVSNSDYAMGSPDGKYASILPGGYLTVGFGTNFYDYAGADVIVVDGLADWISLNILNTNIKIGDIYTMDAHRTDGAWSSLTWDMSLGGWRYLEIYDSVAGPFDAVRLTYRGFGGENWKFEVDAVGVNNGASVPEPSTLIVLGSGLIGFAGWGRKTFRK